VSPVDALKHFAWISPSGSDPGNTAAGNDDLLVIVPIAPMHIKQPTHLYSAAGRTLSQGNKRQVLANADFVGGIDQQICGLF
jgi:hypothetical protein